MGTDSSTIKIHTTLFDGITFCKRIRTDVCISRCLLTARFVDVVSGDEQNSKADLEKVIKSHGGSYGQTAKNADYVIAGSNINGKCCQTMFKKPGVRSLNGLNNLVGVRIKALMQSKEHDIILPKWITDCVKAQDIITISPK
jgi:hypothetical protein